MRHVLYSPLQATSMCTFHNMPALFQIIQVLLAVSSFLSVPVSTQQGCNNYIRLAERDPLYYIYVNQNFAEQRCVWVLTTDSGNVIQLNCAADLDRAGSVCRDSLTVTGSTADGTYCTNFYAESRSTSLALTFQRQQLSPGGRFVCTAKAARRSTCDCGWSFRTRIVGGVEAGVNEFPMMVALIDAVSRSQACGASIIAPTWVVTAAHCLDTLAPNATGILVGDHNLRIAEESSATKLYRAKRFVFHPDYSRANTKNDIGLIEVDQPIVYSMRVGPVCLPFNRPNIPRVGERLTVTGWGSTSFGGPVSDVLLKTSTTVVEIQRCQQAFENRRVSAIGQFCTFARGNDSCQMDSGGPLLSTNVETSRYFLAGLVSYGGVCAGDDPSVNTRVYPYLGFIESVTRETFCIK